MQSKLFVTLVGLVLAGALVTGVAIKQRPAPEPRSHVNTQGDMHELVTYKSATCGCCANWVAYMKARGYAVTVVDTEELQEVKAEHDIPGNLHSCHTTIVNGGQYYIEGHIPEEAIARLMEEEPDINGIGMPGMPAASPGMPGAKTAPFDISQVETDGSISSYMSI